MLHSLSSIIVYNQQYEFYFFLSTNGILLHASIFSVKFVAFKVAPYRVSI